MPEMKEDEAEEIFAVVRAKNICKLMADTKLIQKLTDPKQNTYEKNLHPSRTQSNF